MSKDFLYDRFRRACITYHLTEEGDRILVALSGGKDSLLLCDLLARQQRILRPRIAVEAIHVVMENIPYETDLAWLEQFCNERDVKLHVLRTRFEIHEGNKKPPCFLCSWYRRKAIFQFAKTNKYNKVALGHHQDDILITWLMNITFEGGATAMRPHMQMAHYPISVIRPLCLIPESNIANWAKNMEIPQQVKKCPYERASRRTEIAGIFRQMEALNPEVRHSMWHALGF